MDDKPKIELRKYVAKRVSRKYLLKILFYVVLLAITILVYNKSRGKKEIVKKDPTEIREVTNVTVEQ